ncbi:MAG: tetratricopeptide repeat protein [Planctomycetota bacterium]
MLKSTTCLLLVAAALIVSSANGIADTPVPVPVQPRDTLTGITREDLEPCYNEMMKGNYFAALELANKLVKKFPDDSNALNQRARVYAMMGDYLNAIADEDRAIELQPKFHLWHQMRGYFYLNHGDFDLAFENFAKAVELNPKDTLSMIQQGECRRWQGRDTDALKFFEKVVKVQPKSFQARVLESSAYYHLGDYKKARQLGQKMLLDFGSCADANFFVATYQRDKGDHAKAIESYDEELKICEDNVDALIGRADCRARSGDKEGARADLAKALDFTSLTLTSKQWRGWSPFRLARIFCVRSTTYGDGDSEEWKALDDVTTSFQLLTKAINCSFRGFNLLRHDHDFDAIREDSRWDGVMALVKEIEKSEQ